MMKSIAAVVAGLIFIFATHTGTDAILHEAGVFPPVGQPMFDPALNALALFYRCVFSVLGCALTAWLAPNAPENHALALGVIGTVLSALGTVAAVQYNLGPLWYPLALVVSAIPSAWIGAWLVRKA